MEKGKFDKIIGDNKSVKFSEWSGKHFLFEKESLVIGLFFMHNPDPINFDPACRLMLSVFPLSKLTVDIPLKSVDESTLIIVNSENYEYAMTFLLKIDLTDRTVKVKIEDMPEIGQNIITDEERNGIEVKY